MKLRSHLKLAKWLWSLAAVLAALLLIVIIIPPFINLDNLKPKIETAILNQTGLNIKIRGDVRMSLLGRATISASDITITDFAHPNHIETVSFRIPISKIFSSETAPIPNAITIDGANLEIESLNPPSFNNVLIIRNSAVRFMGKTYGDINGRLKDGLFSGTVRTDEHKYTFEIQGREFVITNPNVNLTITGNLATDELGRISTDGTLAISTNRINKWFDFDMPQFSGTVTARMKYEWSGDNFRFHEISGTIGNAEFSGEIKLSPGHKSIQMHAANLNFDMSFLLQNPEFLKNTDLDLNLSGKLSFMGRNFNKFQLNSAGSANEILINNFTANDDNLSAIMAGAITGDKATLTARILIGSADIYCEFEGSPTNWSCNNFTYQSPEFSGTGTLSIRPLEYALQIKSDYPAPTLDDLKKLRRFFGERRGSIDFYFPAISGYAELNGDDYSLFFNAADISPDNFPGGNEVIQILPASMRKAKGNLVSAELKNGRLSAFKFMHDGSNRWSLGLNNDGLFKLDVNLIDLLRAYYPGMDMKFLKGKLPMQVTGIYKTPYISNLNIAFFTNTDTVINTFAGKFDGRAFDLRIDTLDLDAFINPEYVRNYDSEQFVTAEPLTIPFTLGISATIYADRLIFNGQEYANFAYSLKNNSQQMSITDKSKGSILFTLDKDKTRYNILLQSNKFVFSGNVLQPGAGLNLENTTLTAQARLTTHGITAHDFWANVSGDLDLTFDGGVLTGLGIDQFYANAADITRLNISDAVARMLEGGRTQIKSMHIIGRYDSGIFETSQPFSLRARHADITGMLKIIGGKMAANLDIILRGTAPVPAPIRLSINSDNLRDYSLFEISSKIDPDFMYEFMATHDRF